MWSIGEEITEFSTSKKSRRTRTENNTQFTACAIVERTPLGEIISPGDLDRSGPARDLAFHN
jgi:hypothetical protein